ncbi:MAG: hypothetical protein Q4C71_05055 [Microbacteriaceae bacterium]|nr:hypothetical protein [Microbacteriaceae bacterium]
MLNRLLPPVQALIYPLNNKEDKGPEIIPPVEYSPIWEFLGWALLALVLVYFLLAWFFSRPKQIRQTPPPRRNLNTLRAKYFAAIDGVERAFNSGEFTQRQVHTELSRQVKQFAAEASGVNLDRMTLEELRKTHFTGVTKAVSEYYPQVFSPDTDMPPEKGIFAAREVIKLWR